MNNLGRLIERKLKAKAARVLAQEMQTKVVEIEAEIEKDKAIVAVLHAQLLHSPSAWQRELARDKRRRELVAGGDILWKPVDKVAARVIAKAPWWSFPPKNPAPEPAKPPLPAKPEKTITERALRGEIEKKTKTMSKIGMMETVSPIHVKTTEPIVGHELNVGIANGTIRMADKATNEARELVDKASDARAALQTMAESFQLNWKEFMDGADQRLRDYRIFRMAMDTENRQLMAGVREVRQFFLDANYETERARLKEFVEICERLKALRDCGFLDDVADTMLKLSVKP